MKISHHNNAILSGNYPNVSGDHFYKIGDVVRNFNNEIGVVIQQHGKEEYRTDEFGNVSATEIMLATWKDVKDNRPDLLGFIVDVGLHRMVYILSLKMGNLGIPNHLTNPSENTYALVKENNIVLWVQDNQYYHDTMSLIFQFTKERKAFKVIEWNINVHSGRTKVKISKV